MPDRLFVFRGRGIVAAGIALLLAFALCVGFAGSALADGDPGSDVLLAQNLFTGDANLSTAQQLQLGNLLNATAAAGAPVRVAIIAHPDDLGVYAQLWGKPQLYAAQVLGIELSYSYAGRLLIVMPNGYGVYWQGNKAAGQKLATAFAGQHPSSDSAAALVSATETAVRRIEHAAGVTLHAGSGSAAQAPVQSEGPASGPAPAPELVVKPHSSSPLGVILAALLIIGLTAYIGVRSGLFKRLLPDDGKGLRIRFGPVMIVPVALVGVIVLALIVNQSGAPATSLIGDTLATNAHIDPGTPTPAKAAPPFTLVDEAGHKVSLSQYRGKVVVLSFVDAECETICPLTTQEMLDAKAALGKAGSQVQLLGVDANWKSTQIEDVLNYTQLHGLLGRWHFLTGTLPALQRVWTAYHVNEQALEPATDNDIEHIAATYIIDQQGRLRDLFTTYQAYSAVRQSGQRIAQDVAALLPGHPKLTTHESYAQIPGINPTETAKVPKLGGGTLTVGPGRPHLYLFFATWDATAAIAAHLEQMNAYNAIARKRGLPTITAVDEGSVEPSPQALGQFVKQLPSPLHYPIAIDTTGQLADGYEVQGEPWFVLTDAAGDVEWDQNVYTQQWPTIDQMLQEVAAGLKPGSDEFKTPAAVEAALAGSPPLLAAVHKQASRLLPGGQGGLDARVAKLRGYPVVVNIWASDCEPCQAEFGLFAQASAQYGKRVAFLGADVDDSAGLALAFLASHHVSYPSYAVNDQSIDKLLVGGLQGTPTTLFFSANGKLLSVHPGEYTSQGVLDQDIQDAALGSN